MTFYTTLVLTYVIGGVELQDTTLYRSARECGDALPAVYKPYEKMDSMAQCMKQATSARHLLYQSSDRKD